tara:strand:- start:34808 stop:35266 length:459 start_codon:yes stop_codon:yes gene_type:complete
MRKKRFNRKVSAEINIVPYIDVMLVLLVIFMVTAPLLQQGVSVDLPEASAEALPSNEKEPIVVSVDKNGVYFLNIADSPSLPIESQAMVLRIAADLKRNPQRKVLVKGDQGVQYGKVIGAMVLVQKAGVKGVGLITRDEPSVATQSDNYHQG